MLTDFNTRSNTGSSNSEHAKQSSQMAGQVSTPVDSDILEGVSSSVFHDLPAGIVVIDLDGRVIGINPRGSSLLGDGAEGRLWRELIDETFLPDSGKGVSLRNGQPLSVVTAPLGGGKGQVVLLVEPDSHPISPIDAKVATDQPGKVPRSSLVLESDRGRELKIIAERVARTEATVMLCGESGVGKEVMARFIHEQSPRSSGPYVAINCAAIPENMLEATLFGYEKGAFTGASHARPGKFEVAQNGTLLLDEVSEMDVSLQAKLLRVLQEREVERLGGKKHISLNVRVLATSNRRLRDAVAEGTFREDLYYRLNVFPLSIPPLRERREDIPPLISSLLNNISRQLGRSVPELSAEAMASVMGHDWPGNVRELENVLQRALILQPGPVIEVADLQLEPSLSGLSEGGGELPSALPQGSDLKSMEQARILETLRTMKGNRKQTASILGISERTLRYKLARMRESGIAFPATHENSYV